MSPKKYEVTTVSTPKMTPRPTPTPTPASRLAPAPAPIPRLAPAPAPAPAPTPKSSSNFANQETSSSSALRNQQRRRHSFPVIMNSTIPSKMEVLPVKQTPDNREDILVPDKLQPLQVNVNRPAIDQSGFDTNYDYQHQSNEGCCADIKDCLAYEFSKERLVRGLKARFPCIEWMRHYNVKENIVGDIVSGITVGIMQIPLGMAYALLAGCPPATGLYTSFFAVIIYCLLGTSKHVSQGTFAVISLMFSKTVQMYSTPAVTSVSTLLNGTEIISSIGNMTIGMSMTGNHPSYTPIQVASAIAMMVGIFQVIFGFLRLGALNVYMSDTLVSGFTTGAAVLVFTSQFNSFFGISTPQYNWPFEIVHKYVYIFSNMQLSNVPTIVVSIVAIAGLAIVAEFINPPFQKKFKVPIPIELIAVVVGTGLSYMMHFSVKYKISVVGFIPSGIPAPSLPPTLPLAKNIVGDAIAVAIVSYVIQLSLAKIFAKKHNYEINANQEFIATGVSNVFASFFNCFPMCVALSRSMVHDSVGGKTQLAGLISCGVVLIVLLAIAPLFQTLPNCILAAIIVVAIRRMFLQFRDLKKAWGISKLEAMTWAVTFLSVSLINIDIGLAIGVLFSIMTVIWRSQSPHTSLLGLIPESGLYKDIKRYPTAEEEPGIKIYQFAAPIIFANAKVFRKDMYSLTGVNPRITLKKILKQKNKLKTASKKRNKRRDSLITPNPSSESLDILYARSMLEEKQLNDSIIVNMDGKGLYNNAFELDPRDQPQRFNGTDIAQNLANSRSSGIDSLNESVATLKMYTNTNDNYNGSGPTSSTSGTKTSIDKFSSEISTVANEFRKLHRTPTLLHHIIIDLSCSGFIDSSGVQVLLQVVEEYSKIDIDIYFAACPVPVIDMLESSNFFASVSGDIIFPTVNDAVVHANYRFSVTNRMYHTETRIGLSR